MGIEVNFDGVEAASGFEPLPEGSYRVLIDEAIEKTANTGTAGIGVTMKVIDAGEYTGRLVWDNLWFTPKALPLVRQRLEACGYPIPAGAFKIEPRQLVGRETTVVVRHREYEGKTQVDVIAWRAPEGGQPQAPRAARTDDDIPF